MSLYQINMQCVMKHNNIQDIPRLVSALDTEAQFPSLLLLSLKMCLNMLIACMRGAHLTPWTICMDGETLQPHTYLCVPSVIIGKKVWDI